jgi:AraC family transcriptional activator of mtrCDE
LRGQLIAVFKEIGCSLNDYFLYSKMIYASTLLLSAPDSVVSIAQTIGYATQSHFGKAFKEYFGLTPTEYRKNNIALQPLPDKTIPASLSFDVGQAFQKKQ